MFITFTSNHNQIATPQSDIENLKKRIVPNKTRGGRGISSKEYYDKLEIIGSECKKSNQSSLFNNLASNLASYLNSHNLEIFSAKTYTLLIGLNKDNKDFVELLGNQIINEAKCKDNPIMLNTFLANIQDTFPIELRDTDAFKKIVKLNGKTLKRIIINYPEYKDFPYIKTKEEYQYYYSSNLIHSAQALLISEPQNALAQLKEAKEILSQTTYNEPKNCQRVQSQVEYIDKLMTHLGYRVSKTSPFDKFEKEILESIKNGQPLSKEDFSYRLHTIKGIYQENNQEDEFTELAMKLAENKDIKSAENGRFSAIIYSTLLKLNKEIGNNNLIETLDKKALDIAVKSNDYFHIMARVSELKRIYEKRGQFDDDFIELVKLDKDVTLKIYENYDNFNLEDFSISRQLADRDTYLSLAIGDEITYSKHIRKTNLEEAKANMLDAYKRLLSCLENFEGLRLEKSQDEVKFARGYLTDMYCRPTKIDGSNYSESLDAVYKGTIELQEDGGHIDAQSLFHVLFDISHAIAPEEQEAFNNKCLEIAKTAEKDGKPILANQIYLFLCRKIQKNQENETGIFDKILELTNQKSDALSKRTSLDFLLDTQIKMFGYNEKTLKILELKERLLEEICNNNEEYPEEENKPSKGNFIVDLIYTKNSYINFLDKLPDEKIKEKLLESKELIKELRSIDSEKYQNSIQKNGIYMVRGLEKLKVREQDKLAQKVAEEKAKIAKENEKKLIDDNIDKLKIKIYESHNSETPFDYTDMYYMLNNYNNQIKDKENKKVLYTGLDDLAQEVLSFDKKFAKAIYSFLMKSNKEDTEQIDKYADKYVNLLLEEGDIKKINRKLGEIIRYYCSIKLFNDNYVKLYEMRNFTKDYLEKKEADNSSENTEK